jgi:hypothetical protein
LKPDEIGDLQLVLSNTANGVAKLMIQLIAPDGAIITDTAIVLNIATDPTASIGASNIKPDSGEAQVLDERSKGPEATSIEKSPASLAAAAPAGDHPVPLPSRRPAPPANHNDGANWIKPSTAVNLREGPSPSARVISVVAKGAKLRVIGRKKTLGAGDQPRDFGEGLDLHRQGRPRTLIGGDTRHLSAESAPNVRSRHKADIALRFCDVR